MLGYFTKFGDGACDLLPLADLYKTSVRNLAKHLGIPERIRVKASSPELWPGQTAEKELGLSYEKLDRILWGLERWMTAEEIVEETGLKLALVRKVRERWLKSEHKRRPPLAMKLGYRTAGTICDCLGSSVSKDTHVTRGSVAKTPYFLEHLLAGSDFGRDRQFRAQFRLGWLGEKLD